MQIRVCLHRKFYKKKMYFLYLKDRLVIFTWLFCIFLTKQAILAKRNENVVLDSR